jgi:hypothetical protein
MILWGWTNHVVRGAPRFALFETSESTNPVDKTWDGPDVHQFPFVENRGTFRLSPAFPNLALYSCPAVIRCGESFPRTGVDA